MRRMATALIALAGLTSHGASQDPAPLIGGRDVPIPRKLHAPQPAYPKLARQAHVGGFVFLEVTLDPDGRPGEITILQGHPLLDEAAIGAIKDWRYESSVVNGAPQRVRLTEVIAFFLDDDSRVDTCARLAADRGVHPGIRVFYISQLLQLPPKKRRLVEKVLKPLVDDPDKLVAASAESGLAKLASGVE